MIFSYTFIAVVIIYLFLYLFCIFTVFGFIVVKVTKYEVEYHIPKKFKKKKIYSKFTNNFFI